MRLIKKVLAMSMATAVTFTGIQMPVNATAFENTQTEAVASVQTGVGNEEVTTSDSTATLAETSEGETNQNTDTSAEMPTGDVSTTNETDSGLTTDDSANTDNTVTDSTSTEDKITTEDNVTSDKVPEEMSDTQKMFNDALLENGTITLSEDLMIDEMLELKLPETLEKAEITIALNGYKMTSEKAQAIMHVAENITLTIKGEGSLINSADNGIVIYNEGIVNLDNADLLATGSKSVGVLNNSALGEKGLVIKSGTIKAELFAIGKTAKAEASLNRPTAFFAAAGVVMASASDKTTSTDLTTDIEQGTYSVDENATITDETKSSIEVSGTITQGEVSEEESATQEVTVQEEIPNTTVTADETISPDTTIVPATQAAIVAPEIPTDVKTTINSYNSITISWSSVTNAQGYIIERMQSGTGAYTELTNTTSAAYTDTTISVGKEYKYRVFAYVYNLSNEMLKSAASIEVTGQTSFSAPQSLSAVQASKTKVKLYWNAVDGASQYNVYRAKKGGDYQLIKTLDGTYFRDTGLKTGSKYYYKITAINDDYESESSNTASLYAAAAAVKNLSTSSSSYKSVDLKWKKAGGATKYKIYRSTQEDSGFKRIKTTTSTKYTDSTCKTGVTYYYKIISYSGRAKGGTTSVVSVTPVSAAPTNVKVKYNSYRSATISWKKARGAGSYAIYRSTSKKSGYTLVTTVSRRKTSYRDWTVAAGTKYYYRVRAVTRDQEGKMSKAVAVNIRPQAVKNLKSVSAGGRNVTLSWSAAKGAETYYIYRSTRSNKGYSKIATTSNLTYTDAKLKNGKTYYYRVYSKAGRYRGKYRKVSYVNPSKIYMSSGTLNMEDGETAQLSVTFKPSTVSDSTITWSSANSKIAAVSDKGVVTALAAGVTTITATSINGKTATCEVSVNQEPKPTPTSVVVVLDPGHGGSDPGAVYGGLREKDLTLKTSLYAKAELEKYEGVTVKMTRTDDRYIGLSQRTEIAKNYGADLFVSMHYNAAGSSAANGAEVFASLNSNYNASSTKLASNIMHGLTSLGLSNRGVKTRLSSDGVNDYYSVIRNSVSKGFPGIIVEGGFVTGSQDREILSTEAGLKSIGVATATAIADNYGLSKK